MTGRDLDTLDGMESWLALIRLPLHRPSSFEEYFFPIRRQCQQHAGVLIVFQLALTGSPEGGQLLLVFFQPLF